VDRAYGTHRTGEKNVQGSGGRAQRKETTQKTKAQVGGYYQNGSYKDWLGKCGVDSAGSRKGLVLYSCELGDEPSDSGTTQLVG
jgi:hypothetical protein